MQSWLSGECAAINGLYQFVLGRPADPGGLANGINAIAAGTSIVQLQAELAHTTEAADNLANVFAGATNGGAASTGWVAAMQANLASGWTLGTVSGWLTDESASINGLYQSVLDRNADPSGLAGCLNAVADGVSLTQLAIGMAQSAEATSDINAVYASVLNRAVDPSGLATAQTILASGGGIAGVRSALAGSAEAQADMNALYQQVLGRPATASDLASAQGRWRRAHRGGRSRPVSRVRPKRLRRWTRSTSRCWAGRWTPGRSRRRRQRWTRWARPN